MEKKDLVEFNKNLKFINNGIVKYEDKEGNLKILNLGTLFCQVQFLKVTKEAKKIMLFEKEIDKNMEFKKEIITIPQKDNENPLKIKDVEVQAELMWKVQNGLGMIKIFNNQEEAINLANEINEKILLYLEEGING